MNKLELFHFYLVECGNDYANREKLNGRPVSGQFLENARHK